MSHTDRSQDHAQYGRLSTRARVKKERLNVLNTLVDQICQQLSRHGQDLLKVNWRDEMERLFGIKYNASSQIGLQEECIENEDDFEYLKDNLTQLLYILRNPKHMNVRTLLPSLTSSSHTGPCRSTALSTERETCTFRSRY